MTDKYKIAQEVFDEYMKINGIDEFHGGWNNFLKDKLKPKDPLFEKFVKYTKETSCIVVTEEDDIAFTKFKEIFAEELNNTRGLDAMKEYCFKCSLPWSETAYEEIKKRLES